jgi:hypothetical protein
VHNIIQFHIITPVVNKINPFFEKKQIFLRVTAKRIWGGNDAAFVGEKIPFVKNTMTKKVEKSRKESRKIM